MSKEAPPEMTVTIDFSCPACGAEGYQSEFSADDIAHGVQELLPCDECPATITLSADVRIEASDD